MLAPRSLKCNDGEQIVLTKWEGNLRQKFVDGVSADGVREFNVVGTCGQEITLSTGDFGDSLKLRPSQTKSTEYGGVSASVSFVHHSTLLSIQCLMCLFYSFLVFFLSASRETAMGSPG